MEGEATVGFNPENPNIEVNALFPDVDAFRRALRHFAIKNEFEVSIVKSDKKRFIGKCKHPDCPWRIYASRLQDNKTFMVCMHDFKFMIEICNTIYTDRIFLIAGKGVAT